MAAPVRRNPLGPLRFATLIKLDEALFWNKTKPPEIAPRDDDSIHTVKTTDRVDLLASVELESPALGWAIMERQDQNGEQMRLWPNDFYPGRKIQIPSRDSLEQRRVV